MEIGRASAEAVMPANMTTGGPADNVVVFGREGRGSEFCHRRSTFAIGGPLRVTASLGVMHTFTYHHQQCRTLA